MSPEGDHGVRVLETIETTAHVGPDGILKLEVPVTQRDQNVNVTLVVQPEVPPGGSAALRPTLEHLRRHGELRAKLRAIGAEDKIRLAPPGPRHDLALEPVELSGPAASQLLIEDRR